MKKEKLIYVFVFVALVLHFLAQRQMFPNYIYAMVIALLAAWFFPVKTIMELLKKKGSKAAVLSVLSGFLSAAMLCFSAINLYIPELPSFHTLYTVVGLVNGTFAFVCYLFSLDNEKALFHLALGWFYWM